MAALLLLAAIAQPTPTVDPSDAEAVDTEVRRILAEARFEFCLRDDYPLLRDEAAWCPLLPESEPRCPAFRTACDAPRGVSDALPGRLAFRRFGDGEGDDSPLSPGGEQSPGGGDGAARRARLDRRALPSWDLPDLGGLPRLLFWVVVLGFVVAGLVVLISTAARSRRPPDEVGDEGGDLPLLVTGPAGDGARVETDVDRLMRQARQAAAAGDFAAAIRLEHAALLRKLDGDGLIRLHRSRTHGDYLADLRADPDLRRGVRDVLRDVERVQFGGRPATPEAWAGIAERTPGLMRRAAPLVLLLALLPALPGCPFGGGFPWPTSPSGTAAVEALAAAVGVEIDYRVDPLSKLSDDVGAVVLLGGANPTEGEWERLLGWVGAGGVLHVASGLRPGGGVEGVDLVEMDGPALAADVTGAFVEELGEGAAVVPERSYLELGDSGAVPVLRRSDGRVYAAVAHPAGSTGEVFVYADERLFTNAALAVGGNAALLTRLLTRTPGRVELIDPWFWAGSDTPFQAVKKGRLAPVMVQLLLLGVLLVLWRGVHFGRPRDERQTSRRAFAEHVAAMGQQYARSRASRHALGMYTAWALDQLRIRFQAGSRRDLTPLARTLAARTDRPPEAVERLLRRAVDAADDVTPPSDQDLITLRALVRLVADTGPRR